MKLIPLTKGYSAMVDDADFDWLSQWRWHAKPDGNSVYAQRGCKGENGKWSTLLMHRAIMGVTDRNILVDHWKGNGLNNTRENIRFCTRTQNGMNRSKNIVSSSAYKGLAWHKPSQKWRVGISINGKSTHIGLFDLEEDAARVYNQFAKQHYGAFAKYNDVSPMFPDHEWKPMVIIPRNSTGFRGVSVSKNKCKWDACISRNGKTVFLGAFSDPIEAAKAYDQAARELHGDSARLNFPTT